MIDEHAATDLEQYITSDADLYRQQYQPILKNLATKKVRSQYKHDLAVKLFGYLVESGAKKYAKESGGTWHQLFNVPTRKRVAEELTKSFEGEFELGNYDNFLPKKYQKEMMGVGGKTKFPSRGHATKKSSAKAKVKWIAPEGMKVAWSPVNQAYLALWPGKGRIEDQQVLKVASSRDMHDWLRAVYGESYGLASATSVPPSSWMSGATAGAKKRGSKKSLARLDREIAEVVSSWRGGR